jgi:putative transposase
VIVDYIDAHRDRFGVAPICAVLSEHGTPIAPSTYYATISMAAGSRVSPAQLADAYLANELFDLHRAHRGVYGRRKLWHAAHRAGLRIGGTGSSG